MSAARFAIVGGGFRANYFLRIARALPALFSCVGVVVRDADRARAFHDAWGVAVHPDIDALLAASRPDFVILSVPRETAPALLAHLAQARLPVLCETPPAATLDGLLELWRLVEGGARIQVAEQFSLQPLNAARIAVARSGLLGSASHAQLAATHDYHAVGVLRRLSASALRPPASPPAPSPPRSCAAPAAPARPPNRPSIRKPRPSPG